MENRAYSLLEIRAVDEDARVIRGMATTPTPDRMGDIVDPLGISFKNPLPLLHQHDARSPVGHVTFGKPTKAGVPFEATIVSIAEPGALKDRVDLAWQEVKAKLVRAVSIGFRAIETAFMESGGMHFLKSEVLELSLVTIPANAEATITTIRSYDAENLAASGLSADPPPASRAEPNPPIRKRPVMTRKTPSDRVVEIEAALAAKAAEMDSIDDEVAAGGVTKDAAQRETYETLKSDHSDLLLELKDAKDREARLAATAAPITRQVQVGGNQIETRGAIQVVGPTAPKGTVFTRLIAAKWMAKDSGQNAADIARSRFGDTPEVETILRTAVAAGTTTDATWAGPLVQLQNATNEFLDLLRPATIIGRIPGLTHVPFNVRVPYATTDPTAYWVGEGKVKPVSAAAFASLTLTFAKVAGITVITEELAKFSSPAAEGLLRNALTAAVTYLTDRTFIDPTAAATDISPASITNGVSAVAPTGTTADAFRDDLATMLATYAAANQSFAGLVLVMNSQQAVKLSMMRNTLGIKEFPDVGVSGGSAEGFPVVVSENIPAAGGSPTDGYPIIMLHAPSILLADDGGVDISISREASLVMDNSPDSPETASTVMQSLWQHNMLAIKAERFITWKVARSGAVQLIQGARYN